MSSVNARVLPMPGTAHQKMQNRPRARRKRLSRLIIHVVLILLSLFFVFPFLLVVAGSLSTEHDIGVYGFTLWPHTFSTAAYAFLLQDFSVIANAYGVSILVTVVGTLSSLIVCSLLGYVMSRRDIRWSRGLTFFIFFTTLFSGGLVPTYLVMTQLLHVQDTLLAYILPGMVNVLNVLILRTYFASLPQELIEAAKLDGASEWSIFMRIIVPLSRPALVTIGLLTMLGYWNDWFQGLIYISNPQLLSLPVLLYRITQDITLLSSGTISQPIAVNAIPTDSVLMAMVVIAIGPIMLAFPFTQRLIIRGITLGGLK